MDDFRLWEYIVSQVADRHYNDLVRRLITTEGTISFGKVSISNHDITIEKTSYKYEDLLEVMVEENAFLSVMINNI